MTNEQHKLKDTHTDPYDCHDNDNYHCHDNDSVFCQ